MEPTFIAAYEIAYRAYDDIHCARIEMYDNNKQHVILMIHSDDLNFLVREDLSRIINTHDNEFMFRCNRITDKKTLTTDNANHLFYIDTKRGFTSRTPRDIRHITEENRKECNPSQYEKIIKKWYNTMAAELVDTSHYANHAVLFRQLTNGDIFLGSSSSIRNNFQIRLFNRLKKEQELQTLNENFRGV